jgi:MFS family permease
MGLRII